MIATEIRIAARFPLTKVVILIVAIIVLSILLGATLPIKSDWSGVYRPATLNLISGTSPYSIDNYVAPPWLLIPLIPLAVLPERIGRVLVFGLNIAMLAYLAHKNGASLTSIIAILVSYPVIYGLIYGQLDWLIMMGLVLPPWLGLILLMVKPQIGIGVAVYLAYSIWENSGVKKLLATFLPLFSLVLVCYLIFGLTFFTKASLVICPTNTSLWPRSIPIGLAILTIAIRKREKWLSMSASPFLSPYMPIHTWAVTFVGASNDRLLPIMLSVSSWFVWALGGGAVNG